MYVIYTVIPLTVAKLDEAIDIYMHANPSHINNFLPRQQT